MTPAVAAAEPVKVIDLEETAARIDSWHNQLVELGNSALDLAIRIGKSLAETKRELGHGKWRAWMKQNLVFSSKTAFNYMKLGRSEEFLLQDGIVTLGRAYRCYDLALKAITTVWRAYKPRLSTAMEILLHMREMFKVREVYLTTDAVTELNKDKEASWGDLKNQLTQKTLAQYLNPFGIKSRNKRVDASTVLKAYFYEDFVAAFTSYLGPDPNSPSDSSSSDRLSAEPVAQESIGTPPKTAFDPLQTRESSPRANSTVADLSKQSAIPAEEIRDLKKDPLRSNPLPKPIRKDVADQNAFSGRGGSSVPLHTSVSTPLAGAWVKGIIEETPEFDPPPPKPKIKPKIAQDEAVTFSDCAPPSFDAVVDFA